MRVYGNFFDEDNNLTHGIHEVDELGKVTLVQPLPKTRYKIAENQEELLDAEAIHRFEVDIKETSLLIAVQNEDTVLRYIDDLDKGINPHKVYYYGKDLETCFMCQDRALDCLHYIAYRHPKHKDFATQFVYRYLELRENPEADLDGLVQDAMSSAMIEIQNTI